MALTFTLPADHRSQKGFRACLQSAMEEGGPQNRYVVARTTKGEKPNYQIFLERSAADYAAGKPMGHAVEMFDLVKVPPAEVYRLSLSETAEVQLTCLTADVLPGDLQT